MTGTISAETVKAAATILANQDLQVITITPIKNSFSFSKSLIPALLLKRNYPPQFCRQMATMLNAGITVSDALTIMSAQNNNPAQQKLLSDLTTAVNNGAMLSNAMQTADPPVFSPTVIALIKAGELSGRLDIIFLRLANHLENASAVQEKLITVMLYPLILFLSALTAAAIIITFVLPTFSVMFESFHTPLPLPTKILLSIGQVINGHGLLITTAFGLFLIAVFRISRQKSAREFWDNFRIKLPIIGHFFLTGELLKFSSTLSVLLSSGIVIDKAVEHIITLTQSNYLQQQYTQCRGNLLKGYPLSESLRQEHFFPPIYLELLVSGEATGEIDSMLERIATSCRMELETYYERLRIIAEPLMLLLVAAFIIPLVLAIILPILDTITIFS